ncbi:MAG: sugar phosphate isomerase/epimerase family protein [Syntrophobacteria bacterium]
MPIGLSNGAGERGQVFTPKTVHAGLLDRVQVHAPVQQLADRYLDLFLSYGINPEIGVNAAVLDQWDEAALEKIACRFVEQGRTITLHGPFMDLAPGGVDERIRKVSAWRLQRTMDVVPSLRPQSIVFHAGYDDRRYHGHRREWLANSLSIWKPLSRQAQEMGVVIHLENVYERTPEMISALLEEISSENVGFCLDVGHMNAFAEASLSEWLDVLGHHLREIHLHDNDGCSDAHGPIGSGTVPFKELFRYLVEKGKRPLLTLEPHEEASLWQSLQSLEKLWPWED